MSSSDRPTDEQPLAERPATRREFLGRGAAMAAVAVGAPAVLAACDADTPTQATAEAAAGPRLNATRTDPAAGPRLNATSIDPWITIHKQIVATIGAATNVKVPALAQVSGGYLQRVVVNDERVGTGLATILRASYRFDKATLTVSVQDGRGRAWRPREIGSQEDLVYAACEALSTNTLTDGILRESLEKGRPVVAVFKPAVVQFFNSVASDYYGNHLQVASKAFCDIFNGSVAGLPLASTTRDLSRS